MEFPQRDRIHNLLDRATHRIADAEGFRRDRPNAFHTIQSGLDHFKKRMNRMEQLVTDAGDDPPDDLVAFVTQQNEHLVQELSTLHRLLDNAFELLALHGFLKQVKDNRS